MEAPNELPRCLKGSRCIVHIDLDCFFCQVEQVRLGLSPDIPAAVQQWHGLIAVNYAARAKGVQRMETAAEAKKLCPEIQLIHVATYGPNDQKPQYHLKPNRSTHKVSLDVYREASKNIFKIFHRHCDKIQKIGLDEGYMDMTDKVNEIILQQYVPRYLDKLDDEICSIPIHWEELGITIKNDDGDDNDSKQYQSIPPTTTWSDLQLAIGAKISNQIRKEIFDELHYTCSAGIGHAKSVAKLCSSRNKPDKQTILRRSAMMGFMRDIPFTKIRNMGGKLGNEVENDLGIETAGDAWKYSLKDLQQRFGESTGLWIYNIVRGDDDEEVNATKAPKSLMAAKSLRPPAYTQAEVHQWIGILSTELHNRIWNHMEDFQQWPKSFSISLRTSKDTSYRSKSCPMLSRDSMKSPGMLSSFFIINNDKPVKKLVFYRLTQKTIDLLGPIIEDVTPCLGVSLQANGLEHDHSATNHSITELFAQQQQQKNQDHHSHSLSPNHYKTLHSNSNNDIDTITKDQQQKLSFPSVQSPLTTETTAKTITPQKPKKQGILDFYGKNQVDEEEEDEETWKCDKCFKRISRDRIEEHTDYHFALDLQNAERNNNNNINSNDNNGN
ncbi:hypothetical protein INT45_002327, partial [Circinella minor]